MLFIDQLVRSHCHNDVRQTNIRTDAAPASTSTPARTTRCRTSLVRAAGRWTLTAWSQSSVSVSINPSVLILVILVFHCSQGVWGHPWHWSGGGCYSYLGWGEILQKQHDLHLSFWWMSNFIHSKQWTELCRKSIYWWNPQTRDQQHLRSPGLGRCDSDLDLQHCPAPASVYP